jgi:RNA polymerase sigma-70 factor (ECF subfamily)
VSDIFAIQQGDKTIFELVYMRFHEKLYFYVFKKTGSSYIAEEVVQLTFIKLWNNRQILSLQIPLDIQLFQIAKTLLIDLLRKNANQRKLVDRYKDIIIDGIDDALNPLLQKELAEKLAKLIDAMPPVRKKVFRLSREAGLTHKEIAEQLSLTPKNIENHISKAIRQLKKGLLFISIPFMFLIIVIFFKNIFC